MNSFFHFDRYQCTFPGAPMEDVCRKLHFISAPLETYPRVKGYRRAISFGDVAYLMHEPTGGSYGCHLLVGGGHTCQPIVEEVRQVLPEHRVSRVDVAVDFDYEGSFSELEGIALKVAMEHLPKPLLVDVAGKHYMPEQGGRSTYVGSRQSTHFLRVYEKGQEQRSKGIDPDASINWTRAELEVKPDKKGDARRVAASLTPDEIAHSSPWTAQLSDALGSSCGESIRLTAQRVNSDFVTTMHHMAKQYGPGIRKAVKNGEVTVKEMMDYFHYAMILGQIPRVGLAVEPRRSERSKAKPKRVKVQ